MFSCPNFGWLSQQWRECWHICWSDCISNPIAPSLSPVGVAWTPHGTCSISYSSTAIDHLVICLCRRTTDGKCGHRCYVERRKGGRKEGKLPCPVGRSRPPAAFKSPRTGEASVLLTAKNMWQSVVLTAEKLWNHPKPHTWNVDT